MTKKLNLKGWLILIVAVALVLTFGKVSNSPDLTSNKSAKSQSISTESTQDGKIDESYDLYISNSPNLDPAQYTTFKPGSTVSVKFDESKMQTIEKYKEMYNINKDDEKLQKEYEALQAVAQSDVEVYVIYSKHRAIRANYEDAYIQVYKGKLKDFNLDYVVQMPEFTDTQKEILPKKELQDRENECEVNLVFRFTDEICSQYSGQSIMIPLINK